LNVGLMALPYKGGQKKFTEVNSFPSVKRIISHSRRFVNSHEAFAAHFPRYEQRQHNSAIIFVYLHNS